MSDLFDATAMYDDDYLYFFAAPPGVNEFAGHGPVVAGTATAAVAELTAAAAGPEAGLDALTARFEAERTVVRDGRARRLSFVKRLFGFPELRDWLTAAGFSTVNGYGEDGEPLTAEHKRMIVVAGLP